MKPKLITAILLFISAYSPLFLILIVKDFDFDCVKFKHLIADSILLGITLLSLALLFITIHRITRGNMAVQIKSVSNRSMDIINYTIPYLFCAFDIDLSKPADIITICLFLFILLVLTISSQSVFMNPILAMAGYVFYDVEYEYNKKTKSVIIITKEDIQVGDFYYVRSLTRFLYLITQKK